MTVSYETRAKMSKVKIKAFGAVHTLGEWEKITGIKSKTIWARLYYYNIPIEEALTSKELRGVKNSKAVIQYDKNHTMLNTFDSATDAERKTGIYHVTECCKGKRKTAGGYIWEYQD